MRPGIDIEPPARELAPEAGGLDLLRSIRGSGRDPAALVELELDGLGDLVTVSVSDLAVHAGARAIGAAFTEAFAAARAATEARLTADAESIRARVGLERDAVADRVEAVARQAQEQLDRIAAALADVHRRAGGGRG